MKQTNYVLKISANLKMWFRKLTEFLLSLNVPRKPLNTKEIQLLTIHRLRSPRKIWKKNNSY